MILLVRCHEREVMWHSAEYFRVSLADLSIISIVWRLPYKVGNRESGSIGEHLTIFVVLCASLASSPACFISSRGSIPHVSPNHI